ncbi:hypothetical protein [Ornithinibacillus sp. 179-J 7C1 HS]|uniref:hypothetical protein n=1 Tax=Ornithinibacillus sp. 179-J 7C1 HS TaxID=3142384 RepID=UPI0039A077BA
MKKRMKWLAVILFIGINTLLVLLDDGEKVVRQAYVSTWDKVYQKDLVETVNADGVVTYSGESYVYFDKALGSFEGFLVEEGSTVNVGDPLFTYQVHDFMETERFLTYELEKVSSEIDAIGAAISEMVAFQIPSATVPVVGTNEEDGTTVVVSPQEPAEAEVMKEQFIIQKEQELQAKQEEERIIQSQLEDLLTTGAVITVESPVEGKVSELSSTLDDPIIAIENTALQVKGNIDEGKRVEVDVEQPVEISLKESEQTFHGTVLHVEDHPNDVDVDAESIYPFEVQFSEEQPLDEVLPGYHADLTITVNESLNANTVKAGIVKDDQVWKLNESGNLELVPVETGILMGDELEITSGLLAENTVTDKSIHPDYTGMPFFTPLKFTQVPWLDFNQYAEWKKYMLMGIMVR